eukprot:m.121329 g.121329  ORF g.121329 m.121329 type:complete len:628 (-) comp15634_c0_seq1:62-1945(-)
MLALHGQHASFCCLMDATTLRLRLRTKLKTFSQVFVRSEPDNEEKRTEMTHLEGNSNRYDTWQADIQLNQDVQVTRYVFKLLRDSQPQLWLDTQGLQPRISGREHHFRYCTETPPSWVQQQVFYQIFPDRFANGDDSLTVKDGEYSYYGSSISRRDWGELPMDTEEQRCAEFFGGDLPGVISKLEYLQMTLGVTALYLNPIFTSPSNHKYDTVDYFEVDRHLGGNEKLLDLRQATQERGLKLVLDAVLNHTSAHHPFMDRYGEHGNKGAYANKDSSHRDWFHFIEDKYVAWLGYDSLPKLNLANQAVQDYFWAGDKAVVKHYLRDPFSIDGWRFDVIHMLGDGATARNNAVYVEKLRQAVKATKEDAYFLGEHFYEATTWLQGELEDGAMNYYGFAHPLRAFLAGKDLVFEPIEIQADELAGWLAEARGKMPWQNALSQLNLLDSHDTPRFLTMVEEDVELMKLGVVVLMCYVGVPCVYYGDEVGLAGGNDPDCRRCFPWHDQPSWDLDLLQHYQALISLRRESPCLQSGSILDLYAQGDVYCFARFDDADIWIIAINRGSQTNTVSLENLDLLEATVSGALSTAVTSHDSNALKWDDSNQSLLLTLECKGFLVSKLADTATQPATV